MPRPEAEPDPRTVAAFDEARAKTQYLRDQKLMQERSKTDMQWLSGDAPISLDQAVMLLIKRVRDQERLLYRVLNRMDQLEESNQVLTKALSRLARQDESE